MSASFTFQLPAAVYFGSDVAAGLADHLREQGVKKAGMAISVLLPHVMDYNLPACMGRYRDIAAAMGARVECLMVHEAAKAAVRMVRELIGDTGLPATLPALGVREDLLPGIAEGAMTHGMVRVNPRIPTEAEMLGILRAAL